MPKKKWFTIISLYLFCAGLIYWRTRIESHIPVTWDGVIFLDGVYRVSQGLIPHHDFSTPYGPLMFYLGAKGIIWFYAISMLILIPILFRLYQPVIALSLGLFLGSYLITPRVMGYAEQGIGYTNIQTPLGFMILSFAALIFPMARGNAWSLLFAGFTCVLAFSLKFTTGIAATGLLIGWIYYRRLGLMAVLDILAGITIGVCILGFNQHFDFNPMFRDISFAINSNSRTLTSILIKLGELWWKLPIILAFGCYDKKLCAIFLSLDIFILATTGQSPELWLSIIFVAVMVNRWLPRWPGWIIFLLILIYQPIYRNIKSFREAENAAFFVDPIFNEQLDLFGGRKGSVLVLGNDYLSLSSGLDSIRNVPLYWHNGVTFSGKLLEQNPYFYGPNVFAPAEWVMVPNGVSRASVAYDFYKPVIFEVFRFVKSSEHWALYERRR